MNEKTNSNNKKQEVILGTFLTIIILAVPAKKNKN